MISPAAMNTLRELLLAALQELPSESRRLVHGRGRRWPGLEQVTVDWLQGILLVALFRPVDEETLARLQALLRDLAEGPERPAGLQAILLQQRHSAEPLTLPVWGALPEGDWIIAEQGLKYALTLGRNQNTGLFLDMRLGRQWVRQVAAGAKVLNLFAYTCGFSVAAVAGGAARVTNLDMARSALSRGRENHRLNGHDLQKVEFLGHELFRSWGRVRKGAPYDLIIIDPPSFQKGSFVLQRDYPKILRRLPELLAPGGQVLACVNDPGISAEYLCAQMQQAAPELHFEQRLANPEEFADIDPEGGLKALVFRHSQPALKAPS